MPKNLFIKMMKGQKGITGLETAIILIAFVVVAAVFAYTVLSAGLFSTQKSQEAVYSGLEETQSTVVLKGGVIANGRAMLDSCDYTGWTYDSDVTVTRETSTKWEGAASLSGVIAAGAALNDTLLVHAMQAINFTDGDTITLWIKADAALDGDLTMAVGTGANLQATATQTQAISTGGSTAWTKVTMTMAGGNDDSAAYFGIYLSTDDAGTIYVDKIIIDSLASAGGIPVLLDNCDYISWVAGTNETLTRETTDYQEGNGSAKTVIATDGALNETLVYRQMAAKSFSDGDTITFWVKAEAALDSNITFAVATTADLQGTATQTQLINPTGTGWEKHTITMAGSNDTTAVYVGVYLSTDAEGTFYIDDIQTNAKLSNNDDPMPTFISSVVCTLSGALDSEPIDFTGTSDADTDGILSDESTKTHRVVVYFNNNTQTVADVTWTKSAIGKSDSDNMLENDEKFQLTIDLTYVNQHAGWDYKRILPNHEFRVEVKPPTGAVLPIERTVPAIIKDVNNMN